MRFGAAIHELLAPSVRIVFVLGAWTPGSRAWLCRSCRSVLLSCFAFGCFPFSERWEQRHKQQQQTHWNKEGGNEKKGRKSGWRILAMMLHFAPAHPLSLTRIVKGVCRLEDSVHCRVGSRVPAKRRAVTRANHDVKFEMWSPPPDGKS